MASQVLSHALMVAGRSLSLEENRKCVGARLNSQRKRSIAVRAGVDQSEIQASTFSAWRAVPARPKSGRPTIGIPHSVDASLMRSCKQTATRTRNGMDFHGRAVLR